MMRAFVVLGISVAAAVAMWADGSAIARPLASRTIDRTIACAVGKRAGVRKVEVHARSGTRLFGDTTKWKYLASASVVDPTARAAGLAWLYAGWPPATEPGLNWTNQTLGISTACKQSSRRVPLTSKGLSGFPASPLDDEYHCVVPRRVLVRVSAAYREPTSLRLNRKWGQLTARGVIRRAVVAVRTEAGGPVALAAVSESGKARLYVAGNCEPDLISSDG